MPTYEHLCESCQNEWEDFYSIKADPPTICPSCKQEGCVKRLVSGGSGKGIMRLNNNEFKESLRGTRRTIDKKISHNENFRANIVGEDRYQSETLQRESLTQELVNIGRKESAAKSMPSNVRPQIKTRSSG